VKHPGASVFYTILSMPDSPVLAFLILFLKSAAIGVLTVLTPFIYAVFPITTGILAPRSKPRSEGLRNSLYYVLSLVIIFTTLGVLVELVVRLTGLDMLTDHWLFNFILFRLFVGLGLIFIGAFDIKLPASWADPTASKARADSFGGIFFMALTLPIVAFSSMAPMLVIVLLFTGGIEFGGPIVSLFAFAIGLSIPIMFPRLLQVFVSSKVFLNQVKVILGFISILIGLKFFSYADIALGWNLLDRDMFIILLMLLSTTVGVYMLGFMKLPKDYAPNRNMFGVEYVSIATLFVAVALFTFVVYLFPGLHGAPLHAISGFLPV
jgi:thiol:disulfide interchange protein